MTNSSRHVSAITQNIDDLPERAGSLNVVHLHGSGNAQVFRLSSARCWPPDQSALPVEGALVEPPRCERCNAKIKRTSLL